MFSRNPKIIRWDIINTPAKLKGLAKRMSTLEEFAFDTETNTLKVLSSNKDFSIVGISISWGEYHNYYIPIGHLREEDYGRNAEIDDVVHYLKPIFERLNVIIVGQNIKFDMHVMARLGIIIRTPFLFDVMIASWLCNENTPNGLKENSAYYLGVKQTHFKEVTDLVPKEVKKEFGYKANSKVPFSLTLIDEGAPYALDDAFYTWELYLGFTVKLEEEQMDKIMYKVYVPFLHTLFKMEEKGVTVDVKHLKQMQVEIEQDIEELEYKMFELSGVKFNPSSSNQLGTLLFGYIKNYPLLPEEREDLDWDNLSEKEQKKLQTDYNKKIATFNKETKPLLDVSFKFKPVSKTATGAPQVNADALWVLSHNEYKTKRKKEGVELCKLLLQYKKLSKLKSAFIDGLLEQLYDDGKAHPSFNIIGTDSGRLSCSSPNLQQLPKANEEDKYQIRSLFIGSKYIRYKETGEFFSDYHGGNISSLDRFEIANKKIVALDFSNLEMRVLAHFSKDKNLLHMFANDEDTHGSTAVNMFELPCTPAEVKKLYPHLRQAAKVINFLLMYGGSAPTLYESLKSDWYSPIDLGDKSYLEQYKVKTGVEVAQIYIDKYFATYSGVADFIKNQKKKAHKNGYVQTLLRRKRRLPDINSRDYAKVSYCERLAINSTVQGSAADITISAQNRVDNDPWFYQHGIYMILQVHDELVFECPEIYVDECIKRVKHYMENCFGDNVKLNLAMRADADSGNSYQEAK